MKKVSELYLVACQADTFAEAVDSACSDVIALLGEEGEATKFEMVSIISEFALMARCLRQTSSAAIKRHKEGEENENT